VITANISFVYAKEGKAIALDFEQANEREQGLHKDGWEHTATLDATRFLNNLLSLSNKEVIKELNILKGK
jgi:hypothetical protein